VTSATSATRRRARRTPGRDESIYTLPLGVQAFASQYSVDTARVLAFTALSMIPALIFLSLFERRIVGGLTGAVKG
jgi:raffinose/stachyose/melibiose transport system permease protein